MTTPSLLARLHDDHRRLARLMAVLEHQAQLLEEDGDGPDYDLLTNLLEYIGDYPDAVHHPMEDQLFERLVNKGLTPSEMKLVSVNLRQHAEIIEATRTLAADVATVMSGAVISGRSLQQHARDYVELQRSHMINEEERLFPLAERMLGDDDWEQVAASIDNQHDPLFERTEDRFRYLYRYIVAGDRLAT